MKTLAKTIAFSLAACGVAGAASAPAFAAPAMETMTVRVSTSDINLATPAGQRLLDQRVERAVRQVCRTTSLTTGSRVLSQEVHNCLAKARSAAKQQVAARIPNAQRGG
ncbi:MAG: UrcA family protein [Erythrobacter sp.]